jgi:hypothetical protein
MSLEFKILIDAVKLPAALARPPPQTSTSATFKYQVTWAAGVGKHASEEGATLALASSEGGEVLFHHEAMFRTPKSPDRLLQLTVLQIRNPTTPRGSPSSSGDERSVLGVLVIDLNAHTPKTAAVTSKQRATLALSLCSYDPPAMIRLEVESTKSHLPYDPELEDRRLLDARRRSASRQRSVPQHQDPGAAAHTVSAPPSVASRGGSLLSPLPLQPQSTPRTLEYHNPVSSGNTPYRGHSSGTVTSGEDLLDNDTLEIARLKAALHTLTNANKHLRDDNTLLRNAVQRAREEPSYTYQVQRQGSVASTSYKADASAGDESFAISPEPRLPPNTTHQQNAVADSTAILQAEIAVLQRGLAAAKERILQKDLLEQDLRAEIRSLHQTNTFQAEDIARLEEEVRHMTSKERQLDRDEAELQQQKRTVLELQARSRLLAVELQNEGHLRGKLDEEHKALRKEYDHVIKRRQQSEEEDALRRGAHKALVVQLELRISQAQEELESLHKYAAEANERCRSIANIVESQSKIIETKNGKIKGLKSLLEAQDIYKKMMERSSQQLTTSGKRAMSPGASQRPTTPRAGAAKR